MMCRLLLLKSTTELEEFLFEHRIVYPKQLAKFLNCTYRHSIRIFKEIRSKYGIETTHIPAEIIRKYVEEI